MKLWEAERMKTHAKKNRSFFERAAAAPHLVWAVLFIVAPLLFVFYYSFTDSAGHLTINNITALVDPNYLAIFLRSMCFATVATAICLILAYPLAFFISKASPSKQRLYIVLIMLPMWMNLLIRTYSWMNILETTGLVNTCLGTIFSWFGKEFVPIQFLGTSGAIVLGMVYNFLPYMVLPIYTVMGKLDLSYMEAAQDLGCNNFKVATKVVLPLSVSGIISGITMVFVPSVSTFYISQKMGGGKFDLVGDTIERQFMSNYNYNMGASLSLILMVLIVISVAIMNRFGDEDGSVMV